MSLAAGAASITHLRLTGRDVLDVLHRIGTQSLVDLTAGDGRATFFCDFRGRALHRAWVARNAEAVWLVRPDAPSSELAAFIDRSVFREEVRMEEVAASAAPELPETERFTTELERIRAGHPRHGHEIMDEFTPFELGRAHEVHLNKGCFTGQEALMRLVTYQSVRRQLAYVEGSGPPPPTPADVMHEATRIGRLTSATSRGQEGWVGLAVLARDHASDPMPLTVNVMPLTRVDLFPVTQPLGLPEGMGIGH